MIGDILESLVSQEMVIWWKNVDTAADSESERRVQDHMTSAHRKRHTPSQNVGIYMTNY